MQCNSSKGEMNLPRSILCALASVFSVLGHLGFLLDHFEQIDGDRLRSRKGTVRRI